MRMKLNFIMTEEKRKQIYDNLSSMWKESYAIFDLVDEDTGKKYYLLQEKYAFKILDQNLNEYLYSRVEDNFLNKFLEADPIHKHNMTECWKVFLHIHLYLVEGLLDLPPEEARNKFYRLSNIHVDSTDVIHNYIHHYKEFMSKLDLSYNVYKGLESFVRNGFSTIVYTSYKDLDTVNPTPNAFQGKLTSQYEEFLSFLAYELKLELSSVSLIKDHFNSSCNGGLFLKFLEPDYKTIRKMFDLATSEYEFVSNLLILGSRSNRSSDTIVFMDVLNELLDEGYSLPTIAGILDYEEIEKNPGDITIPSLVALMM